MFERKQHLGGVEEIEEKWKEKQRRCMKGDVVEDAAGDVLVEGDIP